MLYDAVPGGAHTRISPAGRPERTSRQFLPNGEPDRTAVKIAGIVWPDDRVAHIARHGVDPHEVEEVCFGRSLVLRAKSGGENPVYYLLGETAAGRHLFCVVIRFPGDKGYPVTAREMTPNEKRRYLEWKRR